MRHNILIYDCEIIKGILKKGEEPVPGIEYCGGWRDFENMGVSVIGAYDYRTDRYRTFCADNFHEFALLAADADAVVDFNGYQFDKPLIEASGVLPEREFPDGTIEFNRHYDILREIWRAEGHDPDKFNDDTHGNYGLDACCKANFGTVKTGHGAIAPVDWQRGRVGSVIDYCLNDVRLTKQLFDQILRHGYIRNPKDPSRIIEMPDPLTCKHLY